MSHTRHRINPYEPPPPRPKNTGFRLGLIPATMLGFIGVVAILFGSMVVPNVFRDALNGYDARYLILAAMMPTMLFAFGAVCSVASFEFAVGRWRVALKTVAFLLPISLAFLVYLTSLS